MAREIDLGSIIGPAGPKGEKGDPGAQGEMGPQGPKGDPGATTADGVSYKESNVEAALTKIEADIAELQYTPIQITAFTNNVNTAEMGSTVNTVVLNWDYNKKPAKLTLDGSVVDAGLKTKTIESAGIKENKTYTLKATDERDAESTKTTAITFLNGLYWGVGTADATINNDFILGLTKGLQSSKVKTFTVNAGEGQHIYFALPVRYGTPVFKVGGFEGGFAKAQTMDFTNASGYSESYDVYKSDQQNLGDTTVEVK